MSSRFHDELLLEVLEEVGDDMFKAITLVTSFGNISCHFYEAPGKSCGAIWVGGVGGGFDTPARGLYPRLCQDLLEEGVSSLRIRFRNPVDLPESVLDLRTGVDFLVNRGIDKISLAGHSFGGAVVLQAAARIPEVRTVITLATQSYGAEPAALLKSRCSILLVHGMDDTVLPVRSSQFVHGLAHEPKRLVLFPGAGHVLDEVADEVYEEVRNWIISELRDGG